MTTVLLKQLDIESSTTMYCYSCIKS